MSFLQINVKVELKPPIGEGGEVLIELAINWRLKRDICAHLFMFSNFVSSVWYIVD